MEIARKVPNTMFVLASVRTKWNKTVIVSKPDTNVFSDQFYLNCSARSTPFLSIFVWFVCFMKEM